jgi:hypothetical protein
MEDIPNAIVGLPDDLVSPDDDGLFAFVRTLRGAVKAKVAAEQQCGRPLSEIVPQVRALVRAAGENAPQPKPFSPYAYRAISRQAVAWCVEAYRPQFFALEDARSREPGAHLPQPLPPVLAPSAAAERNGSLPPT